MKAKSKDEVDWLRRETRERDENARQHGGEMLGRKHLAHCPSAVDGAVTKVADLADGVKVTITSSNKDAVKEIRERAKHQAEIGKKPDEKKVEHNGSGGGGGALGRCPVVFRGDTIVESKDVADGAELTAPIDAGKIASVKATVMTDVNPDRAPAVYTLVESATIRSLRDASTE